jgi:2-dehydro-3-deoxygalactonokinase
MILSCDWGTSRFRLRLVDVAAERVLGEVSSETGIDRLGGNGPERFAAYLEEQVGRLFASLPAPAPPIAPRAVPLWVSGMASSSWEGFLQTPCSKPQRRVLLRRKDPGR